MSFGREGGGPSPEEAMSFQMKPESSEKSPEDAGDVQSRVIKFFESNSPSWHGASAEQRPGIIANTTAMVENIMGRPIILFDAAHISRFRDIVSNLSEQAQQGEWALADAIGKVNARDQAISAKKPAQEYPVVGAPKEEKKIEREAA